MGDPNILEDNKARRGWWFSVIFLIIVVCLILFLTYVEIVEDNRDVLVGILGVITGSISSMVAIASGRDPSEVDELKEKLSDANADRQALIARLRDAQIQLQLKSDQLFVLQSAVIEKLSMISVALPTSEDNVMLNKHVAQWLPQAEEGEQDQPSESKA